MMTESALPQRDEALVDALALAAQSARLTLDGASPDRIAATALPSIALSLAVIANQEQP